MGTRILVLSCTLIIGVYMTENELKSNKLDVNSLYWLQVVDIVLIIVPQEMQ